MKFKDIKVGMILAETTSRYLDNIEPDRILIVSTEHVMTRRSWEGGQEVTFEVEDTTGERHTRTVRNVRERRQGESRISVLGVNLDSTMKGIREFNVRSLEGDYELVAAQRKEAREASARVRQEHERVVEEAQQRKVDLLERLTNLGVRPSSPGFRSNQINLRLDEVEKIITLLEEK